jgi:predicted small lipoprotein YifL
MKKILALTLALLMALTLAACDGGGSTTPPANNNPTNTPSGNDTSQSDSPLTLQIIDSRNGVFRLHDPNLQERYPIPYSNISHLDSLYQWNIMFGNDNIEFSIIVTMNNISDPSPLKANIHTHINYEPNNFPLDFQISGNNLFFQFSIPESYGFDLNTISNIGYKIINNVDGVDTSKWLEPSNIIVSDIGSGFTPTTPATTPPDGGNNTPLATGPFTITFNPNGGEVEPASITISYPKYDGDPYMVFVYPAIGYYYWEGDHQKFYPFGGWYADAGLTIPFDPNNVASDMTIYAKWLD